MKKSIMMLVTVFFLLFSSNVHALQPQPSDYEKFGRIAAAVMKEDYPGQPLKDYKYQGRQKLDENKLADSFEFTVQENNKEKKVLVKVVHDLSNEKTLNIAVEEVK
jgi:ribosomal protein L21E